MNRQTYQDQADVDNETRIMRIICNNSGAEADRMPDYSPYDFKAYRRAADGKTRALVGLVEIKCRPNLSIHRIRKYKISKAKIDNCIAEARALSEDVGYNVFFFLVVEFKEGIYRAMIDRINAKSFRVSKWGREDRGDRMDIEPCYEVPVSKFKKV